jgi:hypothetical protein
VPASQGRKGGKKGRKVGRNARKPSQIRYNAAKRWLANKAKRVARDARAGGETGC